MRTLAMVAALAAALAAGAHLRAQGASAGQAPGPASTPRMANGKPDLSGTWTGQERGGRGGRNNTAPEIIQEIASRRCAPGQHVDGLPKGRCVNQTLDQEFVREDVVDGKVTRVQTPTGDMLVNQMLTGSDPSALVASLLP
jgi:hypothetical protein